MGYNQMLDILQMMKISSQALLQSWGELQHAVRLYSLAQDNVSLVNPIHLVNITQYREKICG